MHVDTLKFYKYKPVKKPIYQGKFCSIPFNELQIDTDGDVMLCNCPSHMPYVLGNIYKDSLKNIWLNDQANQVRQSVIDGDFTYCSWSCNQLSKLEVSPKIMPKVLDFPTTINLNLDRSCNLKCPSCRENIIIEKNSSIIDKQNAMYKEIVDWALANPHRRIIITPMLSGEIFASHSGLKFLKSLIDYPHKNLKLNITTNGTLISKNQNLLINIKHLLNDFFISIDAATPETYSIVRGGDWKDLMDGIDFVHNIMALPMLFRFCIQKNNWHEIEQFAEFGAKFNSNIDYQKMNDWGHWTTDWWNDNNVFDRTRSTFGPALKSLKLVKEKYPNNIGLATELTKYLEKYKI
jgi:hypothetical protein